ncbi:MAG: hypothetical protein NWS07_05945 [Desulfobacterales bacterium]|nr:hypothetical protein [Desulfobacterales bacterium]
MSTGPNRFSVDGTCDAIVKGCRLHSELKGLTDHHLDPEIFVRKGGVDPGDLIDKQALCARDFQVTAEKNQRRSLGANHEGSENGRLFLGVADQPVSAAGCKTEAFIFLESAFSKFPDQVHGEKIGRVGAVFAQE